MRFKARGSQAKLLHSCVTGCLKKGRLEVSSSAISFQTVIYDVRCPLDIPSLILCECPNRDVAAQAGQRRLPLGEIGTRRLGRLSIDYDAGDHAVVGASPAHDQRTGSVRDDVRDDARRRQVST